MTSFRIQAGSRLVEQQQFGVMHDGLRNRDTLAQSARQLTGFLSHPVGQSELAAYQFNP